MTEIRNELRDALEAFMHQRSSDINTARLCTDVGVEPVPQSSDSRLSAVALVAARALPRYESQELAAWRRALCSPAAASEARAAELWTSADAQEHP